MPRCKEQESVGGGGEEPVQVEALPAHQVDPAGGGLLVTEAPAHQPLSINAPAHKEKYCERARNGGIWARSNQEEKIKGGGGRNEGIERVQGKKEVARDLGKAEFEKGQGGKELEREI